jgi:hypothetical protein
MTLPKYALGDIHEMMNWGQAKTYTITDRYQVYIVRDMHDPKIVTGYYALDNGTEKLTGITNTSQLNKFLRSKSKLSTYLDNQEVESEQFEKLPGIAERPTVVLHYAPPQAI